MYITNQDRIKQLVHASAFVPIIALVSVYLFLTYFRFSLGYWPLYEDTHAIVFTDSEHYFDFIVFSINALVAISPLLFVALVYVSRKSLKNILRPGVKYISAWLVWVGATYIDPVGAVGWYLAS